jgi:diguanylate cyclase (GGDEF)-like protein
MIKKYWTIALIIILLSGAFASTLLTSYFAAYKALGEEISQNTLPLTSDNIYSEIQKDLLLSIHISSLMAHDTFVWNWIISGENNPEEIISYLGNIQKKYETVTSFFVSEKTKRYYHPDGVLKIVSKGDPYDAWYFRSREISNPYEINIDIDTADQSRLTIFVNYQVRGFDDELLGVTGVGLEMTKIKHLLNTYQQKYNSRVFFADNTGIVLLHADDLDLSRDLNQWPDFSSGVNDILTNPETSFVYSPGGRVFYVSSRYIPEFDLFLIILKDNHDLDQRLKDRLKLNFGIGLLITIIIVTIVVIILKKYYLSLENLANFDPLTGALNRNAFSLIFDQAIKEKARKNINLSLVLMDIDHFKSINDKYGHHSGDLALKVFSKNISALTREFDVLCRWGGEEFALLLKGCSAPEAEKVAEKIRQEISGTDLQLGTEPLRITFSAGVAEHASGESLEQLVERADKLMYEAKRQGKNRVIAQK